jgi:hypothetical protein
VPKAGSIDETLWKKGGGSVMQVLFVGTVRVMQEPFQFASVHIMT